MGIFSRKLYKQSYGIKDKVHTYFSKDSLNIGNPFLVQHPLKLKQKISGINSDEDKDESDEESDEEYNEESDEERVKFR